MNFLCFSLTLERLSMIQQSSFSGLPAIYLVIPKELFLINGFCSQWLPVKSGILQRSILGQFAFLIISKWHGLMFADETMLFKPISSYSEFLAFKKDIDVTVIIWCLAESNSKCTALAYTLPKSDGAWREHPNAAAHLTMHQWRNAGSQKAHFACLKDRPDRIGMTPLHTSE